MPPINPAKPASGKEGYYLYGFAAVDSPNTYGPIGLDGPGDEVFTVPWKELAAVVSRSAVKTPVLEPEKAMAHIKEGAGTHFDPKVVEVFLRMRW